MKGQLNFSPKPFRFKEKGLVLFWLLNCGLLILLAVSFLYWLQLREKNISAHGELDGLRDRQQQIVANHENLLTELESVNLNAYRKKVRQFHGIQAAFETHWGTLLDDLGQILPEDVRIVSLKPVYTGKPEGRSQNTLKLTAEARHKKAQLSFVEAMQGERGFDQILIESEDYDQGTVALVFELSFSYQPGEE